MFSYQSGEPLDASKRKTLLRANARRQWPFLTPLDLTMINSELQLAAMVRVRSGISKAQSEIDVHEWLRQVNLGSPPPAAEGPDLERQGAATPRSTP